MLWSDLAGRDVLIVGTGREGRALAERLAGEGADVLRRPARVRAVDEREGEATRDWRASWGERVPVLVAPGAGELAGAEIAVLSPGIPPHAPIRVLLRELGVAETTATALWLEEHAPRTIGVTGSKGKSTTAALVHALAVAHGVDAALGGNIGVPLLSLPAAELYVAELSSYQSSSVTRSPQVVVLTALFPEHLDWHGSERAYYAGKLNLAAHGARHVVVNGDDPRLVAALAELQPELEVEPVTEGARWALAEHEGEPWIARAGAPFVPLAGMRLPGRHNARNAALALAALEAAGVEPDAETAARALAAFRPLEHRLEAIDDPSGVTFVDDSLSTSPYAAVAALESLERSDVVLLLGGQDRGVDTAPLREHLAAHPIAALVGMPDSGGRLLADLAGTGIRSELAEDLPDAVARARALVPPGGVVLLSPAAPSYGRYRDFADRAAAFRRAIDDTSGAG
ncbi:MAG: UDP-N-acetylmuramoyl-L-alanine--D-glutamate ligase [Actinomycetales bacterium]|nr:UDP-N-acetylmuramoyl-L-alanine--D-glutamate ligase [Actinomycetales bacterium]